MESKLQIYADRLGGTGNVIGERWLVIGGPQSGSHRSVVSGEVRGDLGGLSSLGPREKADPWRSNASGERRRDPAAAGRMETLGGCEESGL
jgi:hypothetical protein